MMEVKEMKKIVLVLCLLLSLCSVRAPQPERVIVVFKTAPDLELVAQYGEVHQVFHIIPAVLATLPRPVIDALSRNPRIRYVEPDCYRQYVNPMGILGKPPSEVLPWGVDRIDADLAWAVSKGTGVRVAVIDTGIDMDHPDLKATIKGGFNAIAPTKKYRNPSNFDDDNGHGTHCAGVIGAQDNDIGVIGVAPEAWLYGVKVLDDTGSGYTSDCVEGIQWCVDNGMQVISMSWGSMNNFQVLHDACDAAWNVGCLMVAAAGAEGVEYPDMYPAGYSSVMAVSATDQNDTIASFSNYGAEIELAAPGVSIYSTYKNGGYLTMSGTSTACPHVSGTAALAWAVYPGYTNQQIRQLLWDIAEDLGAPGWDIYYGYGLVDAEAAVT